MRSYVRVALLATLCVFAVGFVSCAPVISDGVVQLPCSTSGASFVRIDTGTAPWVVKIPSLNSSQPVSPGPSSTAWATVNSASWVIPPGPSSATHPGGTYSYTIPFKVPPCSCDVRVIGRFASDNTASAFLDTPAGIAATPFASQATATHGFQAANITPFSTMVAAAQPGNYVLRFEVTNGSGSQSVTGLAVSGIIAPHCTSAPS